uniref:Small integral membrane protein 20 n=1 Tax=Knipowitschia caucasica TaxID=637954 RepID=A0AAV2KRV1_KNICA
MSKNTRIALIFGGFVTAVAAAFYPIFVYPLTHKDDYRKKNNNPAHPDYTPSIFPQAVLKELTKSTTLDRFKRAQKRKAPSTTLVSRKERKVKKQLEFEETRAVQKVNRAGINQADVQPAGMKVWSDPFKPSDK